MKEYKFKYVFDNNITISLRARTTSESIQTLRRIVKDASEYVLVGDSMLVITIG